MNGLAELRQRLDLEQRSQPYDELKWSGRLGNAPILSIDDFSEIPFLDVPGAEEYQHRARLRAQDGDLYAALSAPQPGYEDYCREDLGLGTAAQLQPEAVAGPLDIARSLMQGDALSALIEHARRAGALVIHPFMGIECIWALAARVAAGSGVPIEVLAPPPPITWVANDKLDLSELVETLLGPGWLVESEHSARPEDLAGHLLKLAARHDAVGLKRLRCASATGNKVFESDRLLALPRGGVEQQVRAFLERTEWDGTEPVQVVAWESTELSPSTQLWIPPLGQGRPCLVGIYEQILKGDEGTFVGSRPSSLPEPVHDALSGSALTVACALQELGYVGRCSFDHLILGDPQGDFRPVFVECNGRWGGTSIPMSLLDRLIEGRRPPYRAEAFVRDELIGVPFLEILEAVRSHLFDPTTREGAFIFYNVGPLEKYGKLDVIALGRSQEEADEALEETLPKLLGL